MAVDVWNHSNLILQGDGHDGVRRAQIDPHNCIDT